ncbi:golgin subfamily A member 4-like isoform X2 [Thrips palmi]|uniref:Golgin subfamily A member 4-like isoform X2 n=1 Tax=Thrips palmi TaxID=161013 RepID=A0A6P8ZZ54_THRPL|nr:golgin subfamily A member 4-like isoform X2 [Thrips palmi]
MFKKLKDKLTEEVKIPSQKFTQSMQQLAQAVVSPVSSNNATFDTASNDNFSIDGEFDDTPEGTPVKKGPSEGGVAYRGGQATPLGNSFDTGSGAGFMRVDLQQDSSTPKMPFGDTLGRLRSSSVSSFASDSSFMFPVLESSGSTYNFQSDLESCSEASESVGPNVNKEQLVVAYQKIQQKYHKYKGRYADLARHYRDLERDNKNAKHILTESQDKALRRMAELKEQCNLEKQAKAHLEEALRSDLEEKDHLIDTLKTKIKLLRSQAEQTLTQTEAQAEANSSLSVTDEGEPTAAKPSGQEDLLTGGDSTSAVSSTAVLLTPEPANNADTENVALKEKLKKLESLLHKCKEDITNKRESIKQLEADKNTANAKIEAIQQQLVAIQKREEEASLSLAKNKQTIHLELESKEDEIKKLKVQLTATNNKVSKLQSELLKFQEDSKKELSLAKEEARKPLKAELEEVIAQSKNLQEHLSSKETECKVYEDRMLDAIKRLEENEAQLSPLLKAKEDLELKFEQNTTLLQEEVSQLQNSLQTLAGKECKIEQLKPILDSVQKLHGLHKLLKDDVSNIQSENIAMLDQHKQLIQEKISTTMSNLTQEYNKVSSELDVYKTESENARESLASVSNKFVLLEQTLSTEKSGVESKMTVLEKELKKAEEKIADLEASLKSERSSSKSNQEESSKKLVVLENELSEERSKVNSLKEHFKAAELSLKSAVDELNSKLKNLEQEKARLKQDYINQKEKYDSALSSSDQLQQQLEMLTQRNGESINEMTSLTRILDEKTALIDKLEGTVSELELSLHCAVSEKVELEDKWTMQESILAAQIEAMEKKSQEVKDLIQDMREKEISVSSKESSKVTKLEMEIREKEQHMENLQNKLQCFETDIENLSSRNSELQEKLGTFDKKCQEQTSLISTLQDENGKLTQSIEQLQSDVKAKSDLITDLEKNCAELKNTVALGSEQSALIEKLQGEVNLSKEECQVLRVKSEEAVQVSSKLKEQLQSKSEESANLTHEVQRLNLAHSDVMKMLQQKSDDISSMADKINKYDELKLKLDSIERKQMDDADELTSQSKECTKLKEIIEGLQKEKIKIMEALEEKENKIQNITSQLESMKKEYNDQSKIVHDKIEECTALETKLTSLASDKERLVELLRQKTIECEDKEDKLDNLAEEMKRVEELSQELHRINDDRDANVEVLSTEASSLAEKVEELTITTQELKEREVDLLGKLQVAQNLEAEYLSTKQREELLLSKLNEAKTFEEELKAKEEELLVKSNKINELEEENQRLKEAGQNLTQLIDRAKEAEAKCTQLQDDGAGLLLRIQKAEESEIRCSLLEEELDALKKEKTELSLEVEALHAKAVHQENTSADKNSLVSKEPVVEEPCVVKHYAELTESEQSSVANEWQEKYNQLLEQHNAAMQENSDIIERLTEENLMATSGRAFKQKERLWDRQDPVTDGSSNGSLSLVEKLQQQLAVASNQLKETKKLHRQEVDDLRRILLNHGSSSNHVSSRSDNLEDATELEYLRNILYEYMMGKEPMILARVIAAVVKFDSDQTSKVLQKEQQRLSLLGHLGIS